MNYIIIGVILVLPVVILCLVRPNAGRIFLGFFYLAMGIGVNLPLGLTNPQMYVEMGKDALIPLYRELFVQVVALNPALFVLPIAAFQIAMGLLILNKQRYVKIGLIGTIIFVIAITPLGIHQLPWLGLPLVQAFLLRKEFDRTFLEVLRSKLRPH